MRAWMVLLLAGAFACSGEPAIGDPCAVALEVRQLPPLHCLESEMMTLECCNGRWRQSELCSSCEVFGDELACYVRTGVEICDTGLVITGTPSQR